MAIPIPGLTCPQCGGIDTAVQTMGDGDVISCEKCGYSGTDFGSA